MMMTKTQITNVIKLRPLLDQLHPNIFRENLYHDCDEEDNELGQLLLGKEQLRPVLAKLNLIEDRYNIISRAYIRLTENQKVGFPEIEETGAIIVGKGKPEVEGGTVIPPTEVKVVRPPIPVKPVDTKAPVSREK